MSKNLRRSILVPEPKPQLLIVHIFLWIREKYVTQSITFLRAPCAWDVQKSFDFIIIHSICSELWFDGNSKIDKRSTQKLKTDCLFTIQTVFFLSQLMFWFQLNWEFMYLSADLKYGFCNKSFRKDEPLTSWTLLQHINCPHFWAWLLNTTLLQNPYFRTSALSPGT